MKSQTIDGTKTNACAPIPVECTVYLKNQPAGLSLSGDCGDGFRFSAENAEVRIPVREAEGVQAYVLDARTWDEDAGSNPAPTFGTSPSLALTLKVGAYDEFMALYQHKTWWMRPAFGKYGDEIPENTQLLILRRGDTFQVLLSAVDGKVRTDLSGCGDRICCKVSTAVSTHPSLSGVCFLAGSGSNPYEIVHSCVKAMRQLGGLSFLLREEKTFPEIFAGEGWCSWDSLGRDVSEEAIFAKMDELCAKNHQVTWVLIDDGWMDADREKTLLRGFGPDRERFPGGFKETVRVLKEKYGVKHVGVWQAMKGYWNGIEEGSAVHLEMAEHLCRYGNGELCYKPAAADAFAFWSRWHKELAESGIDFVKIDGQSSLQHMFGGICDWGESLEAVYEGMEASVALHFGGNLINCMGMAPENIWTRNRSTVSRTSDDYLPKDLTSFPEHALQNAFCSILQGEFTWGDWDMFWSGHPDATASMLLRMISGGPVYTSDGTGKTEHAVLAPASDGGRILGCDGIGRPTLDCLMGPGEGKVLKVFNTCGKSVSVAAFDLKRDRSSNAGEVSPGEIPGLAGEKYLLWDGGKQEAAELTRDERYPFDLAPGSARLFSLYEDDGEAVTVIGMGEKYIPAAGIRQVLHVTDTFEVTAGCSGELLVWLREACEVTAAGRVPVRMEKGLARIPMDAGFTVRIRVL